MKNAVTLQAVKKMSLADQIQLVEDIWNLIAAETEASAPTPAQKRELDRRFRDWQRNPGTSVTWEEVKAKMRGKR